MQLNQQDQINKKRLRVDTGVRGAVTAFGLMVLAMFLLIIFHIVSNALPLFKKPSLALSAQASYISDLPIQSVKQMGDSVVTFSYSNCKLVIQEIDANAELSVTELSHACGSQFVQVEEHNYGYQASYAMLRADGMLEIFGIEHANQSTKRRLLGSFNISALDTTSATVLGELELLNKDLSWQVEKFENNIVLYAAIDQQRIAVIWHELGALKLPQAIFVDVANEGSLLLLPRFKQLLVISEAELTLLSNEGVVQQSLPIKVPSSANIMRIPDESALYIPNRNGEIEIWRRTNVSGEYIFLNSGVLELDRSSSLSDIVFSRQSLIAGAIDDKNNILLINSVSNQVVREQNINTLDSSSALAGVADINRKIDFLHWYNQQLYVFTMSGFELYSIQNPAGITTLKSMFSKLQYSGYDSEQYIWQTSQSAEYAQTKFSIIPLIVGSLKASILALLVAIPLALGGAIYTAFFATVKLRNWLKPSIEMIEAIPSVVIGFVAAIWLAPFAERSLFALLGTVIALPILIMGMAALHGLVKRTKAYFSIEKYYVLIAALLFLIVLVGIFYFFNYLQLWLSNAQLIGSGSFSAQVAVSKTTVVVALALGIAVAPTIYSLVDDALFEVPDGIKQASFALGATEIQTLYRVVLLVALPSIISAIMLGLGRAFGETMILLMVTGNTPIADWDLLSGLRALTSNLTIELQESSVGSEHYHILFFTALILFAFTFMINTVAALLKRRLQRGNQHA